MAEKFIVRVRNAGMYTDFLVEGTLGDVRHGLVTFYLGERDSREFVHFGTASVMWIRLYPEHEKVKVLDEQAA